MYCLGYQCRLLSLKFFLNRSTYLVCVCTYTAAHVVVKGQLAGGFSLTHVVLGIELSASDLTASALLADTPLSPLVGIPFIS